MNRFYFGDSDSEESNDENALPYPKPLARSAFLTPDFSPTEFLSSLHNRHQTLEDLRVELRTRSQELNKELLDLVNDNYQDFLGLGSSLRGGEEKIEEVRLGLLRFTREIDGLKEIVSKRRAEVQELYEERKQLSKEVRTGQELLEVDTRLEELEEALRLGNFGNGVPNGISIDSDFTESDESEDEDQNEARTISMSRLRRRVRQFAHLQRLHEKVGKSHPFVVKQEDRMSKVRQAILIDLKSSLIESRSNGARDDQRTLKLLGLYKDLDEPHELLPVLREQKK